MIADIDISIGEINTIVKISIFLIFWIEILFDL